MGLMIQLKWSPPLGRDLAGVVERLRGIANFVCTNSTEPIAVMLSFKDAELFNALANAILTYLREVAPKQLTEDGEPSSSS